MSKASKPTYLLSGKIYIMLQDYIFLVLLFTRRAFLSHQTLAEVEAAEFINLKVSVRILAEAVYRSGGLAGHSYGPVTALAGIRTHQRFVEQLRTQYPTAEVQNELSLQTTEQLDTARVSISGRCDAVVIEHDRILVVEAKSYLGLPENLPPDGERVHWAQSLLYAALYVRLYQPVKPVHAVLAYVAVDTGETLFLNRQVHVAGLDEFLSNSLQVWSKLALSARDWMRQRDATGKKVRFPYPDLRDGQKRLMKEVVGAARHRLSLFACAPTGIGKTMAVLYPAVKALSHHYIDRIFYLTSMTSTRLAAEKACADLRNAGMKLRSVTLTAKEKICPQPEHFCDNRICPLALHYYDNLPQALNELLTVEAVTEEVLREAAQRHKVCPFELALDLSLYADVVIGDYNYAFDPRVRLVRFFGNEEEHDLLLVDEAHNLPDRAREMFTARVSWQDIRETAAAVKGRFAPLDLSLRILMSYCEKAANGLATEDTAIETLEKSVRAGDVMLSAGFRAIRSRPASLNSLINRVTVDCRTLIDMGSDLPQRRLVLDTYFSLLFFLKVSEEYAESAYVTTYTSEASHDLEISLLCLDSADFLWQQIENKHAVVFFSATLHPMSYYQSITVGREASQSTECLELPSPFPSENLLLMRNTQLSTLFKDRTATVQAIARQAALAVTQKVGNYLIFVPSYSYLKMFRPLLQHELVNSAPRSERPPIKMLIQKQKMTDLEKNAFLQAFSTYGNSTLVGVAVIGGQFSEGIDLVGEQLSGVVIIGVGLPQLSPEREIQRQYFGEKLGAGFEFAYQYPGFNRVQQAAGRVIRSEQDRGFVLLIDERYGRPDYESLFPVDWSPHNVNDEQDLQAELKDFFG